MNATRVVVHAVGVLIDCAAMVFLIMACSTVTAKAETVCVAFCAETPSRCSVADDGASVQYPFGGDSQGRAAQYPFQGDHDVPQYPFGGTR